MKMLALLSLASLATLLHSPSAMADLSPTASGPRPGTVEAMRCLVGVRQERADCIKIFRGGAQTTAMPWVFVDAGQKFQRGPLVSSTYWGRASDANMFDAKAMRGKPTKEMDIFDVKFAHTEYTFYISPADAEGKVRALTVLLYAPHDPFQISGCSGGHLCVSGAP
ncbi:MAG: hypothetical protein ABIP64_05095 [Burkholderiales bacterium]